LPEGFIGSTACPISSSCFVNLNDARKSAGLWRYPYPDLNAEDVASEIERYVDAVADLVERTGDHGA